MLAKKKDQRGKTETKKPKGRKILGILGLIILIGLSAYGVMYYTSDTPVFSLPIHNLEDVTGLQVYHDNQTDHGGFDFELENTTEIFAPIEGRISLINRHQMDNGYWIVDVNIWINARWSMFIAFEPWTTDKSVIDVQLANITVKVGQEVKVNDSIGFLLSVPGAEFPHIHWNVNEGFSFNEDASDRSPYDYCSDDAQNQIDYLCAKFGKSPDES